MMPAALHAQLLEACEHSNVESVKHSLDAGAEPNFNIKSPINALNIAIQKDNHKIIELLLSHGAIVKEFTLQKALEKDKNYLSLLIPNFTECKDETLLMAVLHAAINIDNYTLAKQAVDQGAKPASLFLYTIQDFGSTQILQLLIENGFDIHVGNNALLTEWIGSCLIGEWGRKRRQRKDFLIFISEYYLEKPRSITKFKSWRRADKLRLFRMGLNSNNLTMMKFAFLIGVNNNEALNHALYHYYEKSHDNAQSKKISHEIITYMLASNIEFTHLMISNAVCFNYTDVLQALNRRQDLEYAYEMAYKYENSALCDFFISRGVSKKAQNLAKMRIASIKGDIKALRKAVNDGANVDDLESSVIAKIIYANQVETLKYLYDSGVVFDTSFNQYLDHAMSYHKAYDAISYLIELGLNIRSIKKLPPEYKIKYPTFADIWENRFTDIFDYTMHLAREVHPKSKGKERDDVLKRIAELSTLPYVRKRSQGKVT